MISKIFIDTSAFVSLWDDKDPNRIKAINLQVELEKANADIYTSSDIIGETLTVLSKKIGKSEAIKFYQKIKESGIKEIFIDELLHKKTREFFTTVKSKNISFIDCSSVIAMKANKIEVAFTFDKDFKKMGVKLLEDVV